MKRALVLAITLLFFSQGQAETNEAVLRKLMHDAANNSAVATSFLEKTKDITIASEPVLLGFKAMSNILMCKHVSNPFSKLNYFNIGKRILETAIAKDPKNASLIYFRFSTQTNVPAMLGYSSNITSDKLFLLKYLKDNYTSKEKDADLYEKIRSFVLQSKHCSESEKDSIKKLK